MKHLIIVIIFGFLILSSELVLAQESETPNEAVETAHPRTHYKLTTYPNLLKLYWRDSKLNTQEADDLDYYIVNSACDIAKEIEGNDFKREELRDAMARHLRSARRNYSNRFYFIQPLQLGEYNFDKKAFEILPESQYMDVRRIRISNNSKEDLTGDCRKLLPDNVELYERAPLNVVANLNQPFNFLEVPASEEILRLYLDYIKTEPQLEAERMGYIVFYVSLSTYLENARDASAATGIVAEYKTNLDFIEVYADPERKYPLFFKFFEEK
ncbi:MAG: hypothetical protein CMH25_01565 [Micavibrio sp.]|nr:hypothetical protein [Micavibrio sp.]|tara:strand:+ start:306990 stop:307799 length:810 start_codon:yes stop_codon:yes gene_type:complete